MFDITKLLLHIPNALTKDECEFLINEYNQQKSDIEISVDANDVEMKEAKFSSFEIQPYSQAFDFSKKITEQIIKRYVNYLDSSGLFHKAMRNNFLFSHKYRILKYDVGSEIHPHTDHAPFIYGSLTFNLNDNYEGGEFAFFNKKYKLKLKRGDAIIFPADYFWVHEVTKVTKGTRYSLNSFLSNTPYEVMTHLIKERDKIVDHYMDNVPEQEILGPYYKRR